MYPFKNMITLLSTILVSIGLAQGGPQPLNFQAVMSPQDQIRYDFPTNAPHFVLLVQRTGTLSGTSPFDGAKATEYGMHDISPGDEGIARGYVIVETDGGQAFIHYELQATFVPGADGPVILDNGFWRFTGGTGTLAGIEGAGTMHITPASETDREFSFEGEYVLPNG